MTRWRIIGPEPGLCFVCRRPIESGEKASDGRFIPRCGCDGLSLSEREWKAKERAAERFHAPSKKKGKQEEA